LSDLTTDEQDRLARAHQRLREAVAAYEALRGTPIGPEPLDAHALSDAQAEIQAAEGDLWRLREELLGWARPASATRAELVADWFSDEDRVYDDLPAST
jgi:hypothetical protein